MLQRLKQLKQILKSLDETDLALFLGAGVCALALVVLVDKVFFTSDPRTASVMITNLAMNHGGTGIILSSSKNGSSILTNDHVCKVVKYGGVVRAQTGDYQVESVIESQLSDLCLVYVADNLHVRTNVSKSAPRMYDQALISGHPALLPNVLTYGHFSGRQIITVMTGFKPCTEEDLQDPAKMLPCAFFGGIPVVKAYESVLVTATIMPGSSGSGVYNSSNELVNVVFAGQGDLGYAWTVPYEQVINFLNNEVPVSAKTIATKELGAGKEDESKRLVDIKNKCRTATDEEIINICNVLKRDVIQ